MNQLHNISSIVKEREEAYDERFGVEKTTDYWKGHARVTKEFTRTTILQVLESERERSEEEMKFWEKHSAGNYKDGAMQALGLNLTYLDEQIQAIKEMI